MIEVPRTPKPRPERTLTQQERDESAISRVARSSRLSRDLLVRLGGRRRRGELDSEVWDDVTAMLDNFTPGYAPRAAPAPPAAAAAKPATAATLPELIEAIERLSSGLETGRIYDRDIATLRPALNRLGDAWIRRTSRCGLPEITSRSHRGSKVAKRITIGPEHSIAQFIDVALTQQLPPDARRWGPEGH